MSYYKSGLAKNIEFKNHLPNKEFAQFLEKTWTHGLGELAYENQLNLAIDIPFQQLQQYSKKAETLNLQKRALLPFGGGKDSLVSFEQLKAANKDFDLFMVGNAELIKNQARDLNKSLIQVSRKIDSKLLKYNEKGAFNGHVPITSINSAIGVLAALLLDYDALIFSNERSANTPNVVLDNGQKVNHQYSKSYEFEKQFSDLIQTQLARDLHYFSLQRPHSELQILQKFASRPRHFHRFSSCNRNFHLAGSRNQNHLWCGECPKCQFTFLGLAPFVEKTELLKIFGKDLLDDLSQKSGFQELLGLKGIKPFECVGEIEECRVALQKIAGKTEWKSSKLVAILAPQIPAVPQKMTEQIFTDSDEHNIPPEYQLCS